MDLFASAWSAVVEAIFPARCPLCDEIAARHAVACDACSPSLQRLDGDVVPARLPRVWFSRARSVLAYEGKIAEAIHGLKYQQRLDLVEFFVHLLSAELGRFARPDLLVPVPLHPRRLGERGYNQAALLATALGEQVGIPADLTTLQRTRHDLPQVGHQGEARVLNVRGAFGVLPGRSGFIQHKRIVLIDDVMTTGATANECARMLMKGGALAVDALTIARPL